LKTILTAEELQLTIQRLGHQLLENHLRYDHLVVIGIQPRGIFFSDRIVREINKQIAPEKITYGKLDITFYRDDVRQGLHTLNQTDIPFSIENKTVILVMTFYIREEPFGPLWMPCWLSGGRPKQNCAY
jgi:pyrimidine operon attenuation protein/uracil phosphoribosyltransferase